MFYPKIISKTIKINMQNSQNRGNADLIFSAIKVSLVFFFW